VNSLYRRYATVTRTNSLVFSTEVKRTARQLETRLLPVLKRAGLDLATAQILEFGVGWGRNLLALRSLGARDTRGVDVSPEQVALARDVGLETVTLVAPDEDLVQRFGDARFDLLLAIDVIEHLSLPQMERFATAVRTMLSPNGLLVVQVPNDLAPLNPIRCGDLTHLRAFTPESLRQFFSLAGVEPLHIAGIPFPGTGPLFTLRRVMTVGFVLPVLRCMWFLLYGRGFELVSFEPNLLGVARRQPTS
jgi:cyclopropane fatty-acyl-phospholipid synthase-like methyltransferase